MRPAAKTFGAVLAGASLAAALAAPSARAYRLPPEKLLQYWANAVGQYGTFEVRVQHALSGPPGAPSETAPASFLFSRQGAFRFEREAGGAAGLVAVGTAGEITAVRGGTLLPPQTARRYEFAGLFSVPTQIDDDAKTALQAQGVLLDHPGALWLLARLADLGVEWKKTRLAPYVGGKVAYVMGLGYRDALPEGGLAGTAQPLALFDNRTFVPLELRRYAGDGESRTLYRTVFTGYKNEVLQNFPRKISVFVGGLLAEEFTLSSARQNPKSGPEDFDADALRKSVTAQPAAPEHPKP